MGATGSVAFMFTRMGVFTLSAAGIDAEELELELLEPEPDSEPEPDEEDDGRAYTPVATWKKALITFAAWIRRSCDRAAAATASPRL